MCEDHWYWINLDGLGLTFYFNVSTTTKSSYISLWIHYSSEAIRFWKCFVLNLGLDKIEFLQRHENQEIYQKAFELIEHYFGVEEEDSSIAPQVDESQQQFVFQQQEAPMEGFQL